MWEDDRKEIIDNTLEAKREFGYNYGSFHIILSETELQALADGYCIATDINCAEYSVFIYKGENK